MRLKRLQFINMNYLMHILGMRWYDKIRNTEIAERIGLPSLMDLIVRRCNS